MSGMHYDRGRHSRQHDLGRRRDRARGRQMEEPVQVVVPIRMTRGGSTSNEHSETADVSHWKVNLLSDLPRVGSTCTNYPKICHVVAPRH